MNIWTDPSFETGASGLTLEGTAQRLNAPGAWPDGDWGLLLTGAPGVLGQPTTYGKARRTLTTTPGRMYALSVMAQLALGDAASSPLQVQARTAGGAVLATYTLSTGGPSFEPWSPGSFTATESQTVVEFRCERPSSGGGATWALDLVVVDEGDADVAYKILEIRDAIATECGQISIANGDSQDVGEVVSGIKSADRLTLFPSIQIECGDWTESEGAEMARVLVIARYHIGVFNRGVTAADDNVKLTLDIVKRLRTRSGSHWLGLGYIHWPHQVDFNPLEIPKEYGDVRGSEVTVEVHFTRDELDI